MPSFLTALALAALPTLTTAAPVVIDQPPPQLTAEATPPGREGYTWAPGYWNWTGTKHEWTQGHWVQSRKGYRYVSPRWAQENGRWTLYPESWVKDEDDKEKTVMKDSTSTPLRK
jgi:hypothetical protein